VQSILLKGRSFETLLYDPGEVRPSGDVDILIAPTDRSAAERTLGTLGYQPNPITEPHLAPEPAHAEHWYRPNDPTSIDLHLRLRGTHAPQAR
jgi:hypothetical protein